MKSINKLLIAAMERHITWEDPQETTLWVDNEKTNMTKYGFSLDVDIPGEPVLHTPEEGEELPFIAGRMPQGHEYNGTIRKGTYSITYTQGYGWNLDDVGDAVPMFLRMAKSVFKDFVESGLSSWDKAIPEPLSQGKVETVIFPIATVLVAILEEDPTRWYRVTFIDMLALIAAYDARKAGRLEDAQALTALVTTTSDEDSRYFEEEYSDVIARIAQPGPLLVRGGGKQFTAAMGADTRTKGRTYKNASGILYTRAGGDSGLIIQSDNPGNALDVGPGMNKLLLQVGGIIVRDGIRTDGDVTVVRMTIDELLDQRGMKPTRKNRERLKKEVFSTMTSAWCWAGNDGSENLVTISGGGATIKRGEVTLLLSKPFMSLVMNHAAGIVPIDPALLTTDDRAYPSAFAIGYRLTANSFMNHGKPNEYRISVESLLSYVKALPTADEVERNDRGHQTSRIIAPMERSLNYLVEIGVLNFWDYCHSNGEPLTDAEQAARLDLDGNETVLPYDIAKNCLITWDPVRIYEGALQATEDARNNNRAKALESKEAKEAEARRRERRISKKTDELIAKKRAEEATGGGSEK